MFVTDEALISVAYMAAAESRYNHGMVMAVDGAIIIVKLISRWRSGGPVNK